MPQSILIIYQDIDSGAKVVTEKIINNLKQTRPAPHLIVYKQNPLRFTGFLSALKNFFWSLFDCLRVINQHKQTLSALYTPYYLAALAGNLVKNNRQAVIVHFHGDHAITKIDAQSGFFRHLKFGYIWLFGQMIAHLQRAALDGADAVIFVTPEAEREITQKYHLRSLHQRSSIIPNGVDTDFYHPLSTRDEKNISQKILIKNKIAKRTTILLYSGRIDQKKGIDLIFQALHTLKEIHPEKNYFLFVMYPAYKDKDSANYFNDLKNLQKKYSLHITFISQSNSLRSYYQLADLCLLPSAQEMMPLVMLESLACGTPFLGTKVGNMARVLKQVSPQLVLKQPSATAIVKSIEWWHSLNSAKKHLLNERCYQLSKNYTWETTTAKVTSVIQQELGSHSELYRH